MRTLLRIGNAAEDDADREAHEPAVGCGAGGDLRGELTRRGEDQHADLAGLGDLRGWPQAVERGQHESRGLAGAGLGDAEKVAAGEDRRNGLELDGGRLRIIFRGERIEQGLGQPEGMNDIEYNSNNLRTAADRSRPERGQKAPRVN